MRATSYLMPALLATATAVPVGAGPAACDPASVAWTRIELMASKFFLTARSEVELAGRPSTEAIAELLVPLRDEAPAAGKGLEPRAAESYRIDIRTRFLGRDSKVRYWFDPGDARALQRSSHDVSKKRLRHRTYRYTGGGVFSRTLRPGDGEDDLPYAGWSRIDHRFFAFPSGGSPPVIEAAGLLYLIPAGDFRVPGDRQRVRVFTRGEVREVDVAVAAKERIRVDYVEASPAGERAVGGEVEALRVAVRPRVGQGDDDDGFKLLGLEGDIDIYLDPRTRVPLLITGRIQVAGRVRLRLRRAVLGTERR